MTSGKTSFPSRRAAAERNRGKILIAARGAFSEHGAEISMAEVARRAGVGMATLYRNFPGRPELLEALYADEVDALCKAAVADEAQPGEALLDWLRRLFGFLPGKRLILSELLEHAESKGAVLRNRVRTLDASRPLLIAAQEAGEIRGDLTMEQIFDIVAAIAKIQGEVAYLAPLFETLLDGLRLRPGGRDRS